MTGPISDNDESQPERRGKRNRFLKARFIVQSFGKRRRTLLAALAILVVLFASVALLEQQLVHWQFYHTTYRELASAADQIADQIAYSDKWNLQQYRDSPPPIPMYNLITPDGLIIDIGVVVPGILGPIEQPNDAIFREPQTIPTPVNESWRMLGKELDDGYLVVAISAPESIVDADVKLASSLKAFGGTLKEAVARRSRGIPGDIDAYAVVSSTGELKAAWGGVPLRTTVNTLPVFTDHAAHLTANGRSYLLYDEPILDAVGKSVGMIIVGKDLSFEEQALGNYARFNYGIVGGALALAVAVAIALLARELISQSSVVTLEEALKVGESRNIEFKNAFQWDVGKGKQDDELRLATLKSIAGFLNGSGGTLYIGVTDDDPPRVCGIGGDLSHANGSKDKLKLTLRHLITNRIGHEFSPFIVDNMQEANDETYWVVVVQPSPVPAFVTWREQKRFFVRQGPQTTALDPESTYHYIKNKWG